MAVQDNEHFIEGSCIIEEGWDEYVTDEFDRVESEYLSKFEECLNDGNTSEEAMTAALATVGFLR